MSDKVRTYPALDVALPSQAGDRAALEESLAAALDDLDPTAIQECNTSWRVVFASAPARDRAADALEAGFSTHGLTVRALDIADDDWARRSQADLVPVRAGRFIVAPPWRVPSPSERGDAALVLIEPSMGFGTGHHATTRLCLRALQATDLDNRSFLDIGSGSGVLAIAACLLGATPVVALDVDPDAIESARDNLRLNDVAEHVSLVTGDFRRVAGARAEVVAANLTGAAVVQRCREIAGCVEPGGILVVSGFTGDEADTVLSALSQVGELVRTYGEDGWCAATLRVFAQEETRHD